MWYVVKVRTGTEYRIKEQCEKRIDRNVLESCFVPEYEERRKLRGEWQDVKKALFPGYLFVITEQLDELHQLLSSELTGYARLLKLGEDIVPLSEAEVDFLQRFGGEDHVVPVSEGVIENTKVIIHSGPLKGMEAMIKKIDRHKRKAYLEMEMFGRLQRVEVGLEIVRKT